MKNRFLPLCSLLFCGLLFWGLWADGSQEALASEVLRLHVLANSDSAADQALKLQVRDRVVEEAAALLAGCGDVQAAEALLADSLPQLEQAAEETVRDAGFDYPVTARLETLRFPTRDYDGFSLPAGNYRALRILIGDGAGQNWWCVVFPPLCLSGASETAEAAALLTEDNQKLITADGGGYVFRFRSIELLDALRQALA